MRICFASDFHGSEQHYAALLAWLRDVRPRLLILGGDSFPDGEESNPPESQVAWVRDTFLPLVESWKRQIPGMEFALILGNHDWLRTHEYVASLPPGQPLVLLDPQRPWRFEGISFLGFWHTPPTPFYLKDFERLDDAQAACPEQGGRVWDAAARCVREVGARTHFCSSPTLADLLETLPHPEPPWIFVCHAPPYDSGLDQLPDVPHPVGSRSVRRFVARRRPMCALHGHIHDSPAVTGRFWAEVDGVFCMNPGQSDEQTWAVVFDTSDPQGTLRHTVFP